VVRVPGWIHPLAGGNPAPLRGVAARRITPVGIGAYGRLVQGVPLQGGQGQAIVGSGGGATITVGPVGLGVVWYPGQATVSSSVGPLDTSTVLVYLGPQSLGTLLTNVALAGGGSVLSLAVQSMSPGQYFTAVWSGGTTGSIVYLNVTGTMDALAY
jgi:hypothetical protein